MESSVDSLVKLLETFNASSINEDQRVQLLSHARQLCFKLETPHEAATRMIVKEPATMAAVKTSIECGLFRSLSSLRPEERTAKQLAEHTDVEPALMRRLLRLLASVHIVDELNDNRYGATSFASALQERTYESGFRHHSATLEPIMSKLPSFLRQNGFKTPDSLEKGPFQYGQDTALDLWAWYGENPQYASYFNDWMSATHTPNKETWLNAYPISRLLAAFQEGDKQSHALVVDVGGGSGKDMEELRQCLLPEKFELIVQDQQSVVDKFKQDLTGLTFMAHDFFTEQPVRHARAYFIHSTLHNWPDEDVRKILTGLRPAFQLGHSVLLLSESIMPEQGASALQTCVDFTMMALFCVQARTLQDWTRILEASGFQVSTVWRSPGNKLLVIEAEVAEHSLV